jgi:60 kDa SS-A/Ro ribonucleoprotein
VKEGPLTIENATAVGQAIDADGLRVVERVLAISEAGRAPKNDPALFVLAMAASLGNPAVRKAALAALPRVARTGTHLFHFLAYVEGFRGWGRGLRRAVGDWYTAKTADALALQLVKYQQRDGWSHRDALRLAHPKPPTEAHGQLFRFAVGKADAEPRIEASGVALLDAYHAVQAARTEAQVVQIVNESKLPREALPTQWLTSKKVWEALLADMPMEAMVRNLATMTRVGLLERGSEATKVVTARLRDGERIRKARLHPIKLLAALITYQQGRGQRSKGEGWVPVPGIVDALDAAFYLAFGAVEPSNKRLVLGLDVSGSMFGGSVSGVPGLTPGVASAALALVTAATERDCELMAFSHKLVPLTISPRQRLDDVVKAMNRIEMGATDCALPMLWALERKIKADTFVVLTDNETWFGKVHPAQALQQYRERMGINAKLVVVGMVANRFTIANPNDRGMLDVVGFDTAVPQLIADFAAGRA